MAPDEVSIVAVHDVLLATIPANPTDRVIDRLQEDILQTMQELTPAGVILDISTVSTMDSFFARSVAETSDMVSLMGGRTVVVGMRPAVAITSAELGYDLGGVITARDTSHALEVLGVTKGA